MAYPIIFNGDHAEFEAQHAASGKPESERPDWPLPSFDAQDWAAAFCKIATNLGYKDAEGKPVDEGWMVTWFANALMRGYDEHSGRGPKTLCGHITAIYGDLDAEDCAMIDREWAKQRGYILPTDGTARLSNGDRGDAA